MVILLQEFARVEVADIARGLTLSSDWLACNRAAPASLVSRAPPVDPSAAWAQNRPSPAKAVFAKGQGVRVRIRIAHSPDPDDAFMFYGLSSGGVGSAPYEFEHILEDIQTLNEK